jgi:hypothetical protein
MPITDAWSFDRGFPFNSVDWEGAGPGVVSDEITPVDGDYCLNCASNSVTVRHEWVRGAYDANEDEPAVSVYVNAKDRFDDEGGLPKIWFTLGHEDYNIELIWDGYNHTFNAYVDGTKVADGTIEVSENDWFNVQVWIKIDAAGFIKVKIDGHESIDYSGDTTVDPSADSYVDYCYLEGAKYSLGDDYDVYFDNFVIGTGEYLGDCHVDERLPDADVLVDWTPYLGADNYAELDETPESESDYNYTQTDDDEDIIGLADWDNTTDSGLTKDPQAQIFWVRAKAETATGEKLKVGTKTDGGVTQNTEHQLSLSSEVYKHVVLKDPDTTLDWEDAGIDGSDLEYKAVLSA